MLYDVFWWTLDGWFDALNVQPAALLCACPWLGLAWLVWCCVFALPCLCVSRPRRSREVLTALYAVLVKEIPDTKYV